MRFLDYYARSDIQKHLLTIAQNREVQVWFHDVRGRRPDTVNLLGDVKELIKQGTTSFHVSEERWHDPLMLKSGMTKHDLDNLRQGWDCILDLDSKNLNYSTMTAELLIEALKFHGIKHYSLKFSGNRGFHIGIPFEAFPDEVNGVAIKDYFPNGIKDIAGYLKDMIRSFLIEKMEISGNRYQIAQSVNKKIEDITGRKCKPCDKTALEIKRITFECENCKFKSETNLEQIKIECPECRSLLKKVKEESFYKCPKCNTENPDKFDIGNLDPFKVVDIDDILISSRHLFRAPYSINEKSGLVSIPINNIKDFKIDDAKPENVKGGIIFLDRSVVVKGEAKQLLVAAFDWAQRTNPTIPSSSATPLAKTPRAYNLPQTAIPEQHFPACITKILQGMPSDGRKRSVFILINFLRNVGWSIDMIEERLLAWNKKNYEPLRDGYIKSQVSWSKRQGKVGLPPNCANESYYKVMGIYCGEQQCGKCKNPVNYTLRKIRYQTEQKQEKKTKTTTNPVQST